MTCLGGRSRFSQFSILFLILSRYVCTAGRISDVFFSLAVSSGRSRSSESAVVEFDEFGGLPQLENTYRAIGKASSIVALRSVNATILSYMERNSSSIQIPVGAQSLNRLNNPLQYLLITGLSGDARCVVRHAKQVALNYTIAFDSPPPGRFIAHEVGKFLQQFTTRGGTRPLACHLFIADNLIDNSLYEIDAAGNVAQVWAGVGGSNMVTGRNILNNCLNGTAISSIEEAKVIAENILQNSGIEKNILSDKDNVLEEADPSDTRSREKASSMCTIHFVLTDKVVSL